MNKFAPLLILLALSGCASTPTPTLAELYAVVDASLDEGDTLLDAGDRPGARVAFDEALRIAPESPYVLYRVAIAWGQHEPDMGISGINKVLERQERETFSFGTTNFTEGFSEDTRAMLLFVRGHMWRNRKDYEKGLADYRAALKLRPSEEFWEKRLGVYANRGPGLHIKETLEEIAESSKTATPPKTSVEDAGN